MHLEESYWEEEDDEVLLAIQQAAKILGIAHSLAPGNFPINSYS